MLVNNFLNEHTEHYSNGGWKYYYAYWCSKANISIGKKSNSPVFVPEAILYVHIRDSTQGGNEIVFWDVLLAFLENEDYTKVTLPPTP